MNAGALYPLFASMLTNKPWDEVIQKSTNHLKVITPEIKSITLDNSPAQKPSQALFSVEHSVFQPLQTLLLDFVLLPLTWGSAQMSGSSQEKQKIQTYAKQYSKEITELLLKIPRALLLLLKTNDCLRAIDTSLGQVMMLPQHTYACWWISQWLSTSEVHLFSVARKHSLWQSTDWYLFVVVVVAANKHIEGHCQRVHQDACWNACKSSPVSCFLHHLFLWCCKCRIPPSNVDSAYKLVPYSPVVGIVVKTNILDLFHRQNPSINSTRSLFLRAPLGATIGHEPIMHIW